LSFATVSQRESARDRKTVTKPVTNRELRKARSQGARGGFERPGSPVGQTGRD
jgi:hypothetical protein